MKQNATRPVKQDAKRPLAPSQTVKPQSPSLSSPPSPSPSPSPSPEAVAALRAAQGLATHPSLEGSHGESVLSPSQVEQAAIRIEQAQSGAVKKKRGRPAKDPNAPQAAKSVHPVPEPLPLEVYAGALEEPLNLVASITEYEGWKMDHARAMEVAPSVKILWDRYLTNIDPVALAAWNVAAAIGAHSWVAFQGMKARQAEQEKNAAHS